MNFRKTPRSGPAGVSFTEAFRRVLVLVESSRRMLRLNDNDVGAISPKTANMADRSASDAGAGVGCTITISVAGATSSTSAGAMAETGARSESGAGAANATRPIARTARRIKSSGKMINFFISITSFRLPNPPSSRAVLML